MRNVYLDNNATTQVAPEVVDAMQPFFTDLWGNPSSMHHFGGQTKRYIDTAREQAAALLHADPSEIVFTSCGTESDNTAILGAAEVAGRGVRVITSRVEHPAVLGACRRLREHGYDVVEIGVDSLGQLDMVPVLQPSPLAPNATPTNERAVGATHVAYLKIPSLHRDLCVLARNVGAVQHNVGRGGPADDVDPAVQWDGACVAYSLVDDEQAARLALRCGRWSCSASHRCPASATESRPRVVHSAAPGTADLWPSGVVAVRPRAARAIVPAP